MGKDQPQLSQLPLHASPESAARVSYEARWRVCLILFIALAIGATCFNSTPRSFLCSTHRSRPPVTAETNTDVSDVLVLPEGLPTLNYSIKTESRWAYLSPWRPADEYPAPPKDCVISQVNLLQRHGARHPSGSTARSFPKSVRKLLRVKDSEDLDESLRWLSDYEYKLKGDDLLPFGARQSHYLGSLDFQRYSHLFSLDNVPFVRASGSQRVEDSSTNWTAGFVEASGGSVPHPAPPLVLSESRNNSIDDEMCPNANKGEAEVAKWVNVFGPRIRKRLNLAAFGRDIDPLNIGSYEADKLLSNQDTYNLMAVCVLETFLLEEESPWCPLFTDEDWDDFEYYGDLEKFYRTGYGQPLGPVQGVGYANELLARLTGSPVIDHTQTNRTLDASPDTFPLNRTFYADFTHENTMVAIFGAMRAFRDSADVPLDPERRQKKRKWIANEMVPFSARMAVEKMECTESKDGQEGHDGGAKVEYIRLLVNDKPHTLEYCAEVEGRGAEKGAGMCTLKAFVESQAYARSDGAGDWEKCGWKVDGELIV